MTTSFLPGPWVDPEKRETSPWLTHDGIVKFLEFPVRIDAMSHRAFHLYWQRHHSPNVMNVTGFAQFMRKYNSGHRFPEATPNLPAHYRQDDVLEGAAEVWVNSWHEVAAWLGHPLYAELVQPDEPRFISQDGRVVVMVGKEERIYDPDPELVESGRVKLYVLLKRKPDLASSDFHQSISAHWKAIVSRPALVSLLRKLVITHRLADPNPLDFLPASSIDSVVEYWFDSRHQMSQFLATDEMLHEFLPAEAEFSDIAQTRAVVARMRVVHDEFSFQPSTTQPLPFSWGE
jgi:hypothetical protein